MASKSCAKRPSGKWLARYRDEAGKEHTKTFDTKRDGLRWLDEVTTSVLTGAYVDPKNAKVTFRAYAEQWRAGRVHSVNTKRKVESTFRVHAFPVFGDRPIGSLRKSEIQAWVTRQIEDGEAAATIRNRFVWVAAVMKAAHEDRMIPFDPTLKITLPDLVKTVEDVMTTNQVWTLEEKFDKRWASIVRLMAGTGLRGGEATGLCVDQVNFLKRELVVDRQLTDQNPARLGPPKKGKRGAPPRVIPVAQTVIDALSAHIAEYGTGPEGVIFQGSTGGFFNRDQFRLRFAKAKAAAKLPDWVTPHDLRHYYASLLIAHGENVKVVQDRLGHASATMTLDTYSKLWPGQDDSSRVAIDSVLGAFADSLRTEVQSGS